jgi:GGDEF domain-containing protein
LRFKSNEVGLIINNCGEEQADSIARGLYEAIATMEPVPRQGDIPEFKFSATVTWAIWPQDGGKWDDLFQGCYSALLDAWRDGGNKTIRYGRPQE